MILEVMFELCHERTAWTRQYTLTSHVYATVHPKLLLIHTTRTHMSMMQYNESDCVRYEETINIHQTGIRQERLQKCQQFSK